MKVKDKQIYAGIGVLVIIIALIWFFNARRSNPEPQSQTSSTSQTTDQKAQTPTGAQAENVWMGMLKNSDSPAKGNLMLVTKDRTIYIKTSRDFSTLVGKQVNVTYEGSLDSFVLGDITVNEQQ